MKVERFAYLLILLPIVVSIIQGCGKHTESYAIQTAKYRMPPRDNVAVQSSNSLSLEYETFIKLEVNKEEGYEVRRVNELVFNNSKATDTVLQVLHDMSPIRNNENVRIIVESNNRITVYRGQEKPKSVTEGQDEYLYHFGYMQIDTFFVDVVGFKRPDGNDVRTSAERLFKRTGITNDYKYDYYFPEIGEGTYYQFEITDSVIMLIDKFIY